MLAASLCERCEDERACATVYVPPRASGSFPGFYALAPRLRACMA